MSTLSHWHLSYAHTFFVQHWQSHDPITMRKGRAAAGQRGLRLLVWEWQHALCPGPLPLWKQEGVWGHFSGRLHRWRHWSDQGMVKFDHQIETKNCWRNYKNSSKPNETFYYIKESVCVKNNIDLIDFFYFSKIKQEHFSLVPVSDPVLCSVSPHLGSTPCWCSPLLCLGNRPSKMSLLMD